jgi:hypothetical protein
MWKEEVVAYLRHCPAFKEVLRKIMNRQAESLVSGPLVDHRISEM